MQEIRNQADKFMKVSELKNLCRIIAEKMIEVHGYYTFKNEQGQKIFVEK